MNTDDAGAPTAGDAAANALESLLLGSAAAAEDEPDDDDDEEESSELAWSTNDTVDDGVAAEKYEVCATNVVPWNTTGGSPGA